MYIKQKKNEYEEGQDIWEDNIMVMAENKYKSLEQKNGMLHEREKKILALTAMPETLSKKKKTKRNEESNKKYEWKKVALKDLKNGKKYH